MRIGSLTASSTGWVSVDLDRVSATGTLAPRLHLTLRLRTLREHIRVELHHVLFHLFSNEELLGSGQLVGEHVNSYELPFILEILTTPRLLQFVTAQLKDQDPRVSLRLRWSGLLRVLWQQAAGMPPSSIKPGEWTDLPLENPQDQSFSIPRSEWYEYVLKPTRLEDYLFLEMTIPRGEQATNWRAALDHLRSAEQAYAQGDSPAVFAHLKAACEALPGAPQQIFAALPDNEKRKEVNELVKAYTSFLNAGRHVSKTGETEGQFPVDHRDASFALALAKVLLSYTSHLLATPPQ